jgi:hypothetical protein
LGTDIEVEILEGRLTDPPLTLFTQDIHEVNPSTTLGEIRRTNPNDGYVQTTQTDTTEITLDLAWPGGVYRANKKGGRDPYYVKYTLEISPTGADTWTDFVTGSSTITKRTEQGETSDLIRRTFRRVVASGQYDARVVRLTGNTAPAEAEFSNSSKDRLYVNAFYWTALRSIQPNDPRPDKTLACIALRVKRTATGTVERINCLAESYVQDWNGAAWVEAVSSNPASLGRHLLQGSVQPNPIADSRMDLVSWQAFHDHCVNEAFTFNGVIEGEGTTRDRLSVVLSAGRGRLIPPDTKYAVAIDKNGKAMSGMITPRNSSGFAGVHILRDEVQALRAKFFNAENEYQPDERLVFADGYNEGNVEDGKIETFDLTRAGISTPDLAWRHARYRLADIALRLDIYRVTQDFEALQHVPGDLVGFQHDVPLLGLGRGRIKAVSLNGSNEVIGIEIDDAIMMELGKTYDARVRLIDDADASQFIARAVTTIPGETKALSFATPFDVTASPKIGDLLAFGETGLETINCIVKDVLPGPANSAQLVLVDEAPGVNTADTGSIPPFTSQITRPGDFFGTPPAVPVISAITVENISLPAQPDLITTQQLVVQLEPIGSAEQAPEGYEVEFKRGDQADYQRRMSFPADTDELTIPIVRTDTIYDVRVRATGRSPAGIPNASAWSTVSQIFVPIPTVTPGDVARIQGLELYEQGNDTIFVGTDAHLAWRITSTTGSASIEGVNNVLNAFVDPAFSWFEVEVVDPATGHVRRTERITAPEYIYTIGKNKEDSIRQADAIGGSTRPLRQFTVTVAFVDKFSRRGQGQSLTVSNPADDAPGGLLVSGKVSSLFVKADVSDDGDFEKMVVLTSGVQGFALADGTRFEAVGTNVVSIPQPAGTIIYARVAMADRFSDQIDDINFSSEFQVPIEAPDGPPQFTPSGLSFAPIIASNIVQWTSGSMNVLDGTVLIEEPVAAGSAVWTAGTLWLYYVRGSGVIQATTNSQEPQASDRTVVAQYFGGARLTIANALAPIANTVSEANSSNLDIPLNTWKELVELEPMTVAGNPVVLSMMVNYKSDYSTSGPTTGAARIRIKRDGVELRRFGLDSGRTSGAGGDVHLEFIGTISWKDQPSAGTYVYSFEGKHDVDGAVITSSDADFSYRLMVAQEVFY